MKVQYGHCAIMGKFHTCIVSLSMCTRACMCCVSVRVHVHIYVYNTYPLPTQRQHIQWLSRSDYQGMECKVTGGSSYYQSS